MKNFTKLLIVICIFTITTESFAQIFRAKAGLNLSNILEKDNNDTYSTNYKMKPGFHIGATAEFPLGGMFSLETGLLLSTKGYKYSESGTDYGTNWESTGKANLYYFDIPITAKATWDVGGTKIYGALGPYIGIGLSGKWEWDDTYGTTTDSGSETVKWGSDSQNDHLKRLDYGLVFGAGVEISSFQIGLAYNLGLKNISADTGDGYKINNRVIGITVGYKFGGK